jgi:hypothetical protein
MSFAQTTSPEMDLERLGDPDPMEGAVVEAPPVLEEPHQESTDGSALGPAQGDIFPVLESQDARELTRQIKVGLEHSHTLIIAAYRGQVWTSLGYSSWDSYCQGEFGNLTLQPPREERQAVVLSMREAGMSTRAITSATGLSKGTVGRELEDARQRTTTARFGAVDEEDPTPIVGVNGKSYPETHARPQRPAAASWTDQPLSDELLAMSPSAMGIAALSPAAMTSRPGKDRTAAAKRMTGTVDSPLPMVIRLAGEIALDQTELTVGDDADALTLSELATDASRGVLALSHVMTAIDVKVHSRDGDALALTTVVTDAVDELGRFLDALRSRKKGIPA